MNKYLFLQKLIAFGVFTTFIAFLIMSIGIVVNDNSEKNVLGISSSNPNKLYSFINQDYENPIIKDFNEELTAKGENKITTKNFEIYSSTLINLKAFESTIEILDGIFYLETYSKIKLTFKFNTIEISSDSKILFDSMNRKVIVLKGSIKFDDKEISNSTLNLIKPFEINPIDYKQLRETKEIKDLNYLLFNLDKEGI